MVIARGEGGRVCALVGGAGTRTAPSKINQGASFIKKTPSWEIGPKQTAECTTSLGGGRHEGQTGCGLLFGREEGGSGSTKVSVREEKKILPGCIFLLHAGTNPVSCECEFASPQRREWRSLKEDESKNSARYRCPPKFLPAQFPQ